MVSQSLIHIGIVGCGNISETHARASREIDGVEIAAIYGRNRERCERLGQLYGGVVYEDFDAFLEHRPMDVVAIGSPSGLHAEQGIAAARRGLHVLVEKPIDITTARADALIAECERAGVKLGVFFQDRLAPDLIRLKELIDAGRLGRPILISARVKWYRPQDYYSESHWARHARLRRRRRAYQSGCAHGRLAVVADGRCNACAGKSEHCASQD